MIERIDKALELPDAKKFAHGAEKLKKMKEAVEKLNEKATKAVKNIPNGQEN